MLLIALIYSVIMTVIAGLVCMYVVGGEEGKFVLNFLIIMALIQIPTIIYLYKKYSQRRDLFITERICIKRKFSGH